MTEERSIRPERLEDLPGIFRRFDRPWWVAGGWAVDLAVGGGLRSHDDVDVAVLVDDQDAVREALSTWDLHVAQAGELTPWRSGDRIELPRFQLWCRRSVSEPWSLEILFESHDDGDWVFRRDTRVRRPMTEFGHVCAGLDVVAPAVQLLYKAKQPRERDELDFAAALPLLSGGDREWLSRSLAVTLPGHPWIARLDHA